jgi:hypothetical protein
VASVGVELGEKDLVTAGADERTSAEVNCAGKVSGDDNVSTSVHRNAFASFGVLITKAVAPMMEELPCLYVDGGQQEAKNQQKGESHGRNLL